MALPSLAFVAVQRVAVDAIKAHALRLARHSPRAQAHVLTEYLWIEECTEQTTLHRARSGEPAAWLAKLIAAQLADEHRHAALLRGRLAELGTTPRPAPALARVKLWWLERACARYLEVFEAGPIVVVLAVAARLEATGVRMFARHVSALERDPTHPDLAMLRSILGDEHRHARSCAAAAERLVRADERATYTELCARVAAIDRAFGVSLAVWFWILVAALTAHDTLKGMTS